MIREQFLALLNSADYFYFKVFCVLIILCKMSTMWQASGLQFHYNKHDRLMSEFIKQSKIS